MGTKEEWEELERWNNNQNAVNNGLNSRIYEHEKSKTDKFMKILGIIKSILKIIGIIILAVIIFTLIINVGIIISNIKSSFYVDVEKDIETSHGVKIELISKEVVKSYGYKNEDGIFHFKIKKLPDVQFSVVKNGGKTHDDYDGNLQKYLFNNWNNSEKEYFEM